MKCFWFGTLLMAVVTFVTTAHSEGLMTGVKFTRCVESANQCLKVTSVKAESGDWTSIMILRDVSLEVGPSIGYEGPKRKIESVRAVYDPANEKLVLIRTIEGKKVEHEFNILTMKERIYAL